MSARFRLLSVHAHPDDESSKGAPTVAKYHDLGVATTLVCCTGGEAGDILNPAMDLPDVRENIGKVRMEELRIATEIIGYDTVELLGYHDSGMPDTETNARDDNFWNAPIEESTERLVRIIRRDRPEVILTYSDEQGGYNHPDHVRVHEISVPAFERAGDPAWYPEAGEPWQPLKMYYSTWSRRRMVALHEKFLELGIESPFDEAWFKRWEDHPDTDSMITTQVDIRGYYEIREKALLAHATQIDPDSAFWFGLPTEVTEEVHPYEDFILAASRVDSTVPETDIFAGVPGLDGGVSTLVERLGYSADDRLLIINCDDLGMCHSANEGTYDALRNGLATSATLMVPCPWARAAASSYRGEDVGVHLTLTAEFELYRWGPVTYGPSLLGGQGGFPGTIDDAWDHADLDEARRELRAQVERAILWGFDVTHLDCHMGVLMLRPEFFDIYLDLAVDFDLPLRLSGRRTQEAIGFPFRDLADAEGIVVPDHLVVYPGVGARRPFERTLMDLRAGVTEVYLHPATDHSELRSFAPDWADRVDDHHVLTRDSQFSAMVERSGAHLIGWRELRRLQRDG